jgi:hypothetical protein
VHAAVDGLLSLSPAAKSGLLQLARAELLAGGAAVGLHSFGLHSGPSAASRDAISVLSARPKRTATFRPVGGEGASDQLALALGQSRVQLGYAMAATSLTPGAAPAHSPKPPPPPAPSAGASPGMGAAAPLGSFEEEESGDRPAPAGAEAGAPPGNGTAAADDGEGAPRDVVLYFGIIDIFTVYDATKRAERMLKAVLSQGRGGAASVSVAPPNAYAARFRAAMAQLFK